MARASGRSRHILQVELPPPRRKQPRQARSIALVDALITAARGILEQRGREALSLQELSAVAGVAVSSIYEYFPTLDTLVGAIFDQYRRELSVELLQRIRALPPTATLFDGVMLIVEIEVEMRRRELT